MWLYIFYGVIGFIGWMWAAAGTYCLLWRYVTNEDEKFNGGFAFGCVYFGWPFFLALALIIVTFNLAMKDWSAVFPEEKN